jgi:hypothetical protein
MAEEFTEKRNGYERRESARRGVPPELSLEQVYDGELAADEEEPPEDGERRFDERRYYIRRAEDRELHNYLAGEGGA